MHESRLAHDLFEKAALISEGELGQSISVVRVQIGALNHATPTSLGAVLRDLSSGSTVADADWSITKSDDEAAPDAMDVRLISVTVRED